MKLEVHNSFCEIKNAPQVVHDVVKDALTYQNDIGAEKSQLFYQYNLAKRRGNNQQAGLVMKKIKALEAQEWVCWYQDNKFPTGHLNIVRDIISAIGVEFELIDHRSIPTRDMILRWYGKPFPPRYYQDEMIKLGLANGRGVFESAVGTGKSLIMAYLVKELAVNTLVVVPSSGLSDQIYNSFLEWFGPGKVEIVNAQKVRKSKGLKPIRIITIHSLASLQKSGEVQDLIGDVNAIMVDEIHHAGASSYTNLLPEMQHIYYRFGFTGTFLRNDAKSLDMWGFLSNVLYRYPAWKAIEEGYLTPLTVRLYNMNGIPSRKYQTEYDKNYCGNPELLMQVHDICLMANPDEQILILVNKKDKAGKIFHEYLIQNGVPNAYISGDNKKEEITETIRAFNDKRIKVLIGSSVIGEGIDVRATDHLIMCQGGKSEISIVQATGRAIRLFDGKKMAYIHDFNFDNTKYMQKHLEKRIDIYQRNFDCEFEQL